METITYVLKILIVTSALLLSMQIKVGPHTIEEHAYASLKESIFVDQLQEVADGAIKITSKTFKTVSGFISSKLHAASKGQEPGARSVLNLKRSEKIQEELDAKQEKPMGFFQTHSSHEVKASH